MSSSTFPCPAVVASAAESEVVLKIRSKTAQLTVLRRLVSVFDHFTLTEVRLLGEVSITWWRELGCWATVKGAAGETVSGGGLTFVPYQVKNLKRQLAELRKERSLDDIHK